MLHTFILSLALVASTLGSNDSGNTLPPSNDSNADDSDTILLPEINGSGAGGAQPSQAIRQSQSSEEKRDEPQHAGECSKGSGGRSRQFLPHYSTFLQKWREETPNFTTLTANFRTTESSSKMFSEGDKVLYKSKHATNWDGAKEGIVVNRKSDGSKYIVRATTSPTRHWVIPAELLKLVPARNATVDNNDTAVLESVLLASLGKGVGFGRTGASTLAGSKLDYDIARAKAISLCLPGTANDPQLVKDEFPRRSEVPSSGNFEELERERDHTKLCLAAVRDDIENKRFQDQVVDDEVWSETIEPILLRTADTLELDIASFTAAIEAITSSLQDLSLAAPTTPKRSLFEPDV